MKQLLFTIMRVLLIISIGGLGLVGLFMSACGGMVLMGNSRWSDTGWLVAGGLVLIAVSVGLTLWVSKAGNRTVLILFLLLYLPLLLRLVYKILGH